MKKTILFLSTLGLAACSTDSLVPCDGDVDGPQGKLCREYRYYNDAPTGYVQFEHQGDSAFISNIYDNNSELQKTIVEHFMNGRTSVIAEQFPDADSRVVSYHYNGMDSLAFVVYGPNDSSLVITYLDGKRFREAMVFNDETVRYLEYRYYQDDGMLYRISAFDANDSLLSYRNFDYFSGNGSTFYRATHYTGDHELIGRRRFRFSQNGLISSMEFTLADGLVAESKEYIYDSAGKLTEEYGQFYGNTSKSVYLYY